MPLAWTAINLMNIFNGVHSDRENAPEREPSGSNSLGVFVGLYACLYVRVCLLKYLVTLVADCLEMTAGIAAP